MWKILVLNVELKAYKILKFYNNVFNGILLSENARYKYNLYLI